MKSMYSLATMASYSGLAGDVKVDEESGNGVKASRMHGNEFSLSGGLPVWLDGLAF